MLRAALFRTSGAIAPRSARLLSSHAAVATRRLTAAAASSRVGPSFSVRAVGLVPVRRYGSGPTLNQNEVEGRILSLLKGFDKVNDPANIKGTAHFSNDLGLDSLDTVEVVMAIEEEFSIEIPDKDADTIHSVDKAVEYILNQPDAY